MKRILLIVLATWLGSVALAQAPVSKSLFGGVAIGGQDTVAYHANKTGAAIEGEKRFTVEWQGAVWRFTDQASMEKFAADPEKYVPEFNGHCANALSLGEGLVKTDGTVWQFFDDKLYLFYAQKGLARWQQGEFREYRAAAEQAWLTLSAQ